jgi:hypothetical protein
MKLNILRIIPLLAVLLLPFLSSAQCSWRLELNDSGGNGWGGSFLVLTVDLNTSYYALNGVDDDGSNANIYLTFTPGQTVEIAWFNNSPQPQEISFSLFDGSGISVFEAVAPNDLTTFTTTTSCPPCVLPTNVLTDNIYDKRVKVKWTPGSGSANPVGWWVIYGPDGFTPAPGIGDTVYVTTPKATITGLTPKTNYTYYVAQDCGGGVSGGKAGPFDFQTYWTNDVSVTAVLSPKSACDLGGETIEFGMSNPGSNPQSLIPYNFSVNGQAGGVPQPDDGYYTGVIGKDSTEVIEFETSFDFSDQIEYEIAVFTQMTGDQDPTNDTLFYYINNALAPPYAQSFEKWNGGWTVVNDPGSFSNPSWEYGTPDAPIIKSAGDGQKAWVTNLTGLANFAEQSYIQSTCFDLSDITEKPAIEFMINYSCTSGPDGAFVEYSIDEGTSWVRIGTVANTGANWYNAPDPTTFNPSQAWAGESNGWLKTHHLINDVAGEDNVLFRFGYNSGFGQTREGVGIDQFKIFVPPAKDVAAVRVTTLGDDTECGLAGDKVSFNIVNVGGTAMPSGYKLFVSVNGGAPDSTTVSNNILTADENYSFTFPNTFNSRDILTTIKCWVVAIGDENLSNDTIIYSIDHRAKALPFSENFNASFNIPDGWTVPTGANITTTHNNISNVLAYNLYEFNNTFTYDLPRYGIVGVGDSLKFDYRIVDFSFPNPATMLSAGNKIEIRVSTNCGQTYQTIGTINSNNHIVSENLATRKYSLASFVGENIKVRFQGTWFGSGDYYFDLDNVNLLACADNLGLTANIVPTSSAGNTGSATVSVATGNPPYAYNWSNGANTVTATGLGAGIYTVAVLDAHGCSDTLSVEVGVSAIGELPSLTNFSVRPNPTTGTLFLDLLFDQSVELRADIVNLLGQQVWAAEPGNTEGMKEMIDLTRQPAGIYLLRITANGSVQTKKIVIQK